MFNVTLQDKKLQPNEWNPFMESPNPLSSHPTPAWDTALCSIAHLHNTALPDSNINRGYFLPPAQLLSSITLQSRYLHTFLYLLVETSAHHYSCTVHTSSETHEQKMAWHDGCCFGQVCWSHLNNDCEKSSWDGGCTNCNIGRHILDALAGFFVFCSCFMVQWNPSRQCDTPDIHSLAGMLGTLQAQLLAGVDDAGFWTGQQYHGASPATRFAFCLLA